VKVFILYNLRDGITMDDYAAWARSADQPVVARQPGVVDYTMYATRFGSDDSPRYQVVEAHEVTSWEEWLQVNQQPEMRPVFEAWQTYCDPASVLVLCGEKISSE
jgi:hypothetical protein